MAATKLILAVVPSMTTPGRTYVIDATEDGEVRCGCPAWQYHGKPCKHLRALADRLCASWPLTRGAAIDLWPRPALNGRPTVDPMVIDRSGRFALLEVD